MSATTPKPISDLPVRWEDVATATFRIKDHLATTPMRRAKHFPDHLIGNSEVFYKCEQTMWTGSFKERGALNALLRLTEEERRIGVTAASAGNHSQALAYHCQRLKIPVTVLMPTLAPLNKVANCRAMGANVLLHGANILEAKARAEEILKESGQKYINGYDHPDIIAGAGTIGIEIMEQLPNLDVVVVPVGGGGLLAGISLAIKSRFPHVKVIAVESENCPSFSAAMSEGKPVLITSRGTIADGLAVPQVGSNAFEVARHFTDEVIRVDERYIANAVLWGLEKEKALLEGAGATAIAAIISGKLSHYAGKRICAILCGGNIDITMLGRVIERGLYSSGRMMQFDCPINDQPGGMANFTTALAATGASLKEIMQEHPFISDVNMCSVHCTVETRDAEHGQQMLDALRKKGFQIKVIEDGKWDNVTSKILSTQEAGITAAAKASAPQSKL